MIIFTFFLYSLKIIAFDSFLINIKGKMFEILGKSNFLHFKFFDFYLYIHRMTSTKALEEKHQKILRELLQEKANKRCFDCIQKVQIIKSIFILKKKLNINIMFH